MSSRIIGIRRPGSGRGLYRSASSAAAAWTPADLGARLVSWWMRLGTLGTSGSNTVDVVDANSDNEIDTLRDLGYLGGGYARDAGRDLVQAATANQPTATLATGGRYAADFDENGPLSKDGMTATSTVVTSSAGGACVVYKPRAVSVDVALGYNNQAILSHQPQNAYQGTFVGKSGAFAFGWDGANKEIKFGGRGASEQTPSVIAYVYNGSTFKAICNDSGLQSVACGNITNLFPFSLGNTGSQPNIDGLVYEAFAFSSASDAELQQMVDYAAARWSFSTTWTPASIYGMAAWYRSDSATVTGGVVDSLTNLVSGGANATASGATRPTYNATDAAYGGKPSLSFDGTDDTLLASGVNYSQHTVFMVARSAGQSGYRPFYRRQAVSGNDIDYCSHRTDALFIRNNALTASYKTDATAAWGVTAAPITIRVQYGGTHATHNLWKNGSAVSLTSSTAGDPGALTNGNLRLMSDAVTYTQGTMVEFIVYNRVLSAAETTLVENYLRARYGHY